MKALPRIRRRIVTQFFVCAAILLLGQTLIACSSDAEQKGEASIRDAKQFSEFPIYYSGSSIAGEDLEEILGNPTGRDAKWFFLYGDCEHPPLEGGCQIPLQIHNYSACSRWTDPPESKLFDFRGAKAIRVFGRGPAALEVFTGRTTVTITAESRRILDLAGRALRGVRQRVPGALPAPAPGSLSGQLPCQKSEHASTRATLR